MKKVLFGVPVAATAVICAAIFAGVLAGKPFRYFEEKTVTTFFSGSLLLGIGWLCHRMRQMRHVAPERSFWKPETAIWGLMALGFAYLALDEVAQIHEHLDKLVHRVFHIKETNLTDRLDDAIVGLYGIGSLGAMLAYRKELAHHRHALPFVIAGFTLFFIMVGLDVFTSRTDLLGALFQAKRINSVMTVFAIAEESCKLYAGVCFLLAFYSAVCRAKDLRSAHRTAPASGAPNPRIGQAADGRQPDPGVPLHRGAPNQLDAEREAKGGFRGG